MVNVLIENEVFFRGSRGLSSTLRPACGELCKELRNAIKRLEPSVDSDLLSISFLSCSVSSVGISCHISMILPHYVADFVINMDLTH